MTRGARASSFGLAAAVLLAGLVPAVVRADAIDDLVAQVSQANIQTHVTTLAAAPRDTPAAQAAAADYIAGRLGASGYSVVRDPVGRSENVIARLPGTVAPDRVFVIGAHFDSIPGSPGADDNASGVAGLLEIARVLAGSNFPATIEFIAFGLEEAGLLGSNRHAGATLAAGRDVAGMISLEMIGYTCRVRGCTEVFTDDLPCFDLRSEPGSKVGTWIGVVASMASEALGRAFVDAAARHVPALEVEWGVVQGAGTCFPDTRRSDHAPFWDRGFRALLVTDTANFRNANYHLPSDLPATIDFAFARRVTQATLATAVQAVSGAFPARSSPAV